MTQIETTYLDYNATTPVDPQVLEHMLPYFSNEFGNAASRTHPFGWRAGEAVENARSQIARSLGAKSAEIVFTSGATESTNLALRGLAASRQGKTGHFISWTTEHKATLDTLVALKREGHEVTLLEVGEDGLIDLAALDAAVRENTWAVSLMMVNNETGVIQDLAAVGALCAKKGILFHCDAAQGFGKLKIDVNQFGLALMSVSGHKIYAPKGVGFLYVRSRQPKVDLREQIAGGGHEFGFRSGTLNVPGIVGLGQATQVAEERRAEDSEHIFELRERLHQGLCRQLDGVELNGSNEQRIYSTLNLSFQGIESETLLLAMPSLALSSGSACTSDSIEPSHVLKAMGLKKERGLSAIRFALGRFSRPDEVDRAIGIVAEAVNSLRSL